MPGQAVDVLGGTAGHVLKEREEMKIEWSRTSAPLIRLHGVQLVSCTTGLFDA
jgi:hypothetical protein